MPATSQMRCWLLPNGRIFPAAAGLLCVGLAYCTRVFRRCPHVGATWGFCGAPAHTLAVGAESRTQRRHAPHGAVQALGTPAGSIGPIFFTVGRSAPSTRFQADPRRSAVAISERYLQNAVLPLEPQRFSAIRCRVTCFGVIPGLASGRVDLCQTALSHGAPIYGYFRHGAIQRERFSI